MGIVTADRLFQRQLSTIMTMRYAARILSPNPQNTKSNFIDKVRLYVRGGHGGNGKVKYGGKGGQGGHVYVVGEKGATLRKLIRKNPSKRIQASAGCDSTLRALLGAPGENVELMVPAGVSVCLDSGEIIGEVNQFGDRVLIARGGEGGGPQNRFLPQQGDAHSISLDLKLIADVGLVGFPNAGKSTFLKAVSRASPKIASYPFTTLKPQLGIMNYNDHRKISVADLPGLIEGAHYNIGLGHSFLKHVERTRVLLFVVDVTGFRLSLNHQERSAYETVLLLNKELELYKEELVTKPSLLVVNKMDLRGTEDIFRRLKDQILALKESASSIPHDLASEEYVNFDDIISISAKNQENVDEVKEKLRMIIDRYDSLEKEAELQDNLEKAQDLTKSRLSEHTGKGLV
ncbi:hypothetical protein CAPTEDRAFT_226536 [Capitella teleta]|uniref:OBG-type G domain-containing protein n=1 Tax=Capitella teleta TaxID=283909 RepID=R7TXN3_CAPTE|nr:hypothetical protein CAPTEDRAFT_226536 [Capitella teleta]|eukprot:ELT96206.1 hypothetical protein CAPTEDRAFT_226536 [Capitella teleta]